ncbi:uncharacterized protein LOC135172239 [Diachasmimorpha longicaudata]|uniref:uncharacterized protein LOC135172239 n=1 Tax=Diachasmimorpha longicaudata TaxID=58733 RepID=UPI0030B8B4E4
MRFVTHSYFIIYAVAFSAAEHQYQMPIMKFNDIEVDPWNLEIPENPWWKGTMSKSSTHPDTWIFDEIEYLKDIPINSSIRLDYTVQYSEPGFFSKNWVNLFHDSVLLCDKTEETQDASIIALVRELLGIPEGCPLFAGEKRNTTGIHFPLKNRELFFNRDVRDKHIRILTTMRVNAEQSEHKLFMGEFYVIYPATLLIYSHRLPVEISNQ